MSALLPWATQTLKDLANALPVDYYDAAVTRLGGEDRLLTHLTEALDRCHADAGAYTATFPPPNTVFLAPTLCPLDRTRVVIVGQDPYTREGQAHGLAFSVLNGDVPPSLVNVVRRVTEDLGRPCSSAVRRGNLTEWASQGVLLLNRTLTVRAGKAGSHSRHDSGWMAITQAWIEHIAATREHVVFMLWGNAAQRMLEILEPHADKHLILTASHPSPLGCRQTETPFIQARHFSECNAYLIEHGHKPIVW